VFLPDFIESGGKFACKSGTINKPSSISIVAEKAVFSLDFIESGNQVASKSGTINQPT